MFKANVVTGCQICANNHGVGSAPGKSESKHQRIAMKKYLKIGMVCSLVILLVIIGTLAPMAPDLVRCMTMDLDAAIRRLEPITASDINGTVRCISGATLVKTTELPGWFAPAVVLSEDRRFSERKGALDFLAIAGALLDTIEGHPRGASTIWMQLVRCAGLIPGDPFERSFRRKLCEAILAIRLSKHITKNHCLELYFSTANFGSNTRGVREAAWRFFSISKLSELKPLQGYWLIANLTAPN
jgi:penicillin-binding protein 1A